MVTFSNPLQTAGWQESFSLQLPRSGHSHHQPVGTATLQHLHQLALAHTEEAVTTTVVRLHHHIHVLIGWLFLLETEDEGKETMEGRGGVGKGIFLLQYGRLQIGRFPAVC